MASGTPLVASDLPSIREIVDEEMVWFFEPDNPESLAYSIKQALENENESQSRAAKAQAEAEKYTWEKRAKRILEFVQDR